MPKIGIFWFSENKVIGKARDLREGVETNGSVDSPDEHFRLWEQESSFRPLRQMGVEYQEIPRGRVVWREDTNAPVVYMDKRLLASRDAKQKVAAFFELPEKYIQWQSDPHYTTDPDEINRLWGS